jgi:hypothetical protein
MISYFHWISYSDAIPVLLIPNSELLIFWYRVSDISWWFWTCNGMRSIQAPSREIEKGEFHLVLSNILVLECHDVLGCNKLYRFENHIIIAKTVVAFINSSPEFFFLNHGFANLWFLNCRLLIPWFPSTTRSKQGLKWHQYLSNN